MLRVMWQWLTRPTFALADAYLCCSCQTVLCGPSHARCPGQRGPQVVHLHTYLQDKNSRIMKLTSTLALHNTPPTPHTLSAKEADIAAAHADFWWQKGRK